MNAPADHPTATELEQLAALVAAPELDRDQLGAALREIDQGLRAHGRELDESGGLLDEADKARRMSLAREDDRLRDEGAALSQELSDLQLAIAGGADDQDLRRRTSTVLAGLRGHRNAEASLVLENVDTEVGSGD